MRLTHSIFAEFLFLVDCFDLEREALPLKLAKILIEAVQGKAGTLAVLLHQGVLLQPQRCGYIDGMPLEVAVRAIQRQLKPCFYRNHQIYKPVYWLAGYEPTAFWLPSLRTIRKFRMVGRSASSFTSSIFSNCQIAAPPSRP